MHDASSLPHRSLDTFRYSDHNCEAEIQGALIALKCKPKWHRMVTRKKRGCIKEFSRASRLRMLKMVARINWPKARTGLFVTLTFPDECLPMVSIARMRAVWELFRRMEKSLGHSLCALWRCEWLPRDSGKHVGVSMPHYHLIIFSVRYFPYWELNAIWKSVLGVNTYVRTECKRLANERAHGGYIAKYCAKVPSVSSLVSGAYSRIDGKHWGYYKANALPLAIKEYFTDLPAEVVETLRKIGAAELKWYDPEVDKGFCILGRFGRRLVRQVLQLLLDSEAVSR